MPTVLHSGNYVLAGNAVLGPDSIVFQEKPVVGLRLDGIPQKQGYNAMEWRYATVPGDEMKLLQDAWLNTRGQGLTVTFVGRDGTVQTGRYYMQQPVIGKRRTFYYDGVVIRFTATYRTGIDATAALQAGTSAGYDRFLNGEVFVSSILTREAFGTFSYIRRNPPLRPSSIASAQAFGSIVVDDRTIRPTAIASAFASGSPEVSGGAGSYVTIGQFFPAQLNGIPGPFIRGTDMYVILAADDSGTAVISVMKSDLTGAVWTEQDSAFHPQTGQAGTQFYTYGAFRDADDLVVSYSRSNIYVDVFDLTTDTWNDGIHVDGPIVGRTRGSGYEWVSMYAGRRSDGTFLVGQDNFFAGGGANTTIKYNRSTEDPDWSTGEVLGSSDDGTDYMIMGVAMLGDDQLFVWRERDTESSDDGTIKMRVYDSANNLGSISTIGTSLWSDSEWSSPLFPYDDDGTPSVGLIYVEPGGDVNFLNAAQSDLTTWTDTTIVSSPLSYTGRSVIVADPDNADTIYALWLADGFGIAAVPRIGGTWGSSTVIASDNITAFGASMRSGGIIDLVMKIGSDMVYTSVTI